MSNHSGKTIEPLKPGDPPKFLDTKFANQFVRLYNAVMNLRLKNGRALISDTAIDLELDASPASGGGGTDTGFPFYPFKIIGPLTAAQRSDPEGEGLAFQVRPGNAAFRPKFWYDYLKANNESVFPVRQGTSPMPYATFDPTITTVLPAAESVAVGNVGDYAGTTNSCEFVLPTERDGLDNVYASFFIRFSDTSSDTQPDVQIVCRMFTDSPFDATGRSLFAFDNDPNTIPIGKVFDFGGIGFACEPWLTTHATNRYGQFPNNMGPTCYRGDWDEDSLSGQVFYPGDLVRVKEERLYDCSGGIQVLLPCYQLYSRVNYGTSTSLASGWILIGGLTDF